MTPLACPCGASHQWNEARPELAQMVKIIQERPLVEIRSREGIWNVPRVYVAAHGIKAIELRALAELYGWERLQHA